MSAGAVAPVRIVLVRHGRAEAGWDHALDPGLDDLGRTQAIANAEMLAPMGPWPIVTSPLRRCRETATPLATRWATTPVVEPAVAELPSPDGVPMHERTSWLRSVMVGTWSQLDGRYAAYRGGLVDRLLAIDTDTVVVSHFVAINAAIGAALDDDRLVIASLDNCSRTVLEVAREPAGRRLRVVSIGDEADTLIR